MSRELSEKKYFFLNKAALIFFCFNLSLFLCGFSSIGLSDIATAIIQKDFAKAKSLSEEFIKSNPPKEKEDKAYYYLALSQLNLDQYDLSRKTFLKLIKRAPEKSLEDKAYLGIIDAYYIEENYFAALAQVEKLLKHKPQPEMLSLVYLKTARAHFKLSHWDKAEEYLKKIINEFPDGLENHLAKQLLEEKQYFAVQVGAFIDRERAERLMQELQSKGEYSYIVETIDQTDKKFYRVRVGQLVTLNEAEKLKQRLSSLGYPTQIYP